MINDRLAAERVLKNLNYCAERLNETIRYVRDNCSDTEFEAYRKAVGFLMGCMYTDVIANIYQKHPDLEPPEMKD